MHVESGNTGQGQRALGRDSSRECSLDTQIDRIQQHPNVLVLATSNFKESLDSAFLDRCDLIKELGAPSTNACVEILTSGVLELMRTKLVLNISESLRVTEGGGEDTHAHTSHPHTHAPGAGGTSRTTMQNKYYQNARGHVDLDPHGVGMREKEIVATEIREMLEKSGGGGDVDVSNNISSMNALSGRSLRKLPLIAYMHSRPKLVPLRCAAYGIFMQSLQRELRKLLLADRKRKSF